MSITKKLLKGMGLTDEQQETILEAHTTALDAIKAERDRYKTDAAKLPDVQKELDDRKAAGDGGWKDKHDSVKKQFDEYKANIEARENRAAKEQAARAYFESKNIDRLNINLAMRSSAAEIEQLELDGNKIKDTTILDALIAGDLASLVAKPSANVRIDMGGKLNSSGKTMTREEIVSIKDGTARRKAMMEHPELFGLNNKI